MKGAKEENASDVPLQYSSKAEDPKSAFRLRADHGVNVT